MDLKIRCDKCHQSMDNKINVPRSLPCGHSLCQKCISDAINGYYIDSCMIPPVPLKCCTCKITFSPNLKLKDFPFNFSIIDILTLNDDRKISILASRARNTVLQMKQTQNVYESFIQKNNNEIEIFSNLYNDLSNKYHCDKVVKIDEIDQGLKSNEILDSEKSNKCKKSKKKKNSKHYRRFEEISRQQNL